MWSMLPNEAMYPYTAKEARDRGELELWRANFRTNCACAGAIELAIHRDFDGMHLKDGCAKSVIDQYGYRRVGYVLANTLQLHAYDGRYLLPQHPRLCHQKTDIRRKLCRIRTLIFAAS